MKRYVVLVENAGRNYSAYLPDVPGCVAVGDTVEETLSNMREALEFHFEGMARDGDPIPEPATIVGHVEVEIPQPAKRKTA